MGADTPVIRLEGVSKRYVQGDTTVHALRDVSLEIRRGEFVAIVGASGSGKSTMLNVLGCLDQVTDGEYRLMGKSVAGLSPDALAAARRNHFGFVFQQYNLLPSLTALANVALPGLYAGGSNSACEKRAAGLLKQVGLGERLHHKPSQLSGGQQQRVSIARSLMNGGDVILADEPTGALDSASGKEMLALLKELNRAGHTVIVVTHDMGVAAHADRVIEMRDGMIVEDRRSAVTVDRAAGEEAERAAAKRSVVSWFSRCIQSAGAALSSLRNNRLRTALSLVGISIGIAAVTAIVAVSDATKASIEDKLSSFLSGRLLVTVGNPSLPPGQVSKLLSQADRTALARVPGVRAVKLERESVQSVRYAGTESAMTVVGGDRQVVSSRKYVLDEGRNLTDLDIDRASQVVVIDEKARDRLFGVDASAVGREVLVGTVPAIVAGVVHNDGAAAFGSRTGLVFLPESTYVKTLDSGQDVSRLTVLVEDKADPGAVRSDIVRAIVANHGVEDFEVNNLAAEFSKIGKVTMIMTVAFAGIAAISLVVGGVGVMNIVLVSVSERTREIGVRMAIGARRSDVKLQFLIESVMLCCAGGAFGVLIAWLITRGISRSSSELQVGISSVGLAIAFTVSTLIGLVSGVLPARRAAAMNPVAALARD